MANTRRRASSSPTAFMARLDFDMEERESIFKLIRLHLEMSNAMRRDIFDIENVRGFAEKIGSPSLLKMLTLMTYADIKAVNPEALTPWKAENLWQFYMATANFMDRSVDEVRYHAAIDPTLFNRIRSMVPPASTTNSSNFSRAFPTDTCKPASPNISATIFSLPLTSTRIPSSLTFAPIASSSTSP